MIVLDLLLSLLDREHRHRARANRARRRADAAARRSTRRALRAWGAR